MIFRRKKKKHVNDDNQLLLFTVEEMEGGNDVSSRTTNVPSSTEVDEGLQEKQVPIADVTQPAKSSSSAIETSPVEEREDSTNTDDSVAVSHHEETIAEPDDFSNQITDNRNSVDHHLLLESMRKAIIRLSTLSVNDVRLIAIESATHAQRGINTDHTYSMQALRGEELSGYDFIAYYYVSFARSFPTMLDKIDLPFSDIYEKALSLGK